jgi:hypothetical protein
VNEEDEEDEDESENLKNSLTWWGVTNGTVLEVEDKQSGYV